MTGTIAHWDDTAPDVLNRVKTDLGDPTITATPGRESNKKANNDPERSGDGDNSNNAGESGVLSPASE